MMSKNKWPIPSQLVNAIRWNIRFINYFIAPLGAFLSDIFRFMKSLIEQKLQEPTSSIALERRGAAYKRYKKKIILDAMTICHGSKT